MQDHKKALFLLEQAQTHMQFGTWKIDARLNEFFISDELCDMFTLDKNKTYDFEIINHVIYKDDKLKVATLFQDAASLGISFNTTFRSDVNGTLQYFCIYCDIEHTEGFVTTLYGFIQDVTHSMKEEEKQKNLVHLTEEHIIISQTDLKGKITYISKAFSEISGFTKEELIGRNHNLVRHPDIPSYVFKDLWKTLENGESWEGEIKNLKKNGGFYWVYSYISPYKNYKGEIIGYQSVRHDITAKKYIEQLSITDGLTSLYNRRYFDTIMPKEISQSRRLKSRLVFVMLDVDNFKIYNDTYGHQNGDQVLVDISQSLRQNFQRTTDKLFRLGGEEFGIVFSLYEDEDMFIIVDKARQAIEDLGIEHKESTLGIVTASFGVIQIQIDSKKTLEEEMKSIYKYADKALYKAKAKGRNRVVLI